MAKRQPAALRKYWAHHKRRGNPHHKHHRHHRRHNPGMLDGNMVGNLTSSAKAGLIGASGALGLDLLWGYTSGFLPSFLNSGYVMYLSKAIGAVLIGVVGGKIMPGRSRDLTVGAMTVVIHDVLKSTVQAAMPTLPLGSYVGTSPIVAYGAPAVGVPHLGVPFRTPAIPAAHRMGAYAYRGAGDGVSGYTDGGPDGTEWS